VGIKVSKLKKFRIIKNTYQSVNHGFEFGVKCLVIRLKNFETLLLCHFTLKKYLALKFSK